MSRSPSDKNNKDISIMPSSEFSEQTPISPALQTHTPMMHECVVIEI
jgi:DNA mismatch repair protein MutS